MGAESNLKWNLSKIQASDEEVIDNGYAFIKNMDDKELEDIDS